MLSRPGFLSESIWKLNSDILLAQFAEFSQVRAAGGGGIGGCFLPIWRVHVFQNIFKFLWTTKIMITRLQSNISLTLSLRSLSEIWGKRFTLGRFFEQERFLVELSHDWVLSVLVVALWLTIFFGRWNKLKRIRRGVSVNVSRLTCLGFFDDHMAWNHRVKWKEIWNWQKMVIAQGFLDWMPMFISSHELQLYARVLFWSMFK